MIPVVTGVDDVFCVLIVPEWLTVVTVNAFVPISRVPPDAVVNVPLDDMSPAAVLVPLVLLNLRLP